MLFTVYFQQLRLFKTCQHSSLTHGSTFRIPVDCKAKCSTPNQFLTYIIIMIATIYKISKEQSDCYKIMTPSPPQFGGHAASSSGVRI